MLFQRKGPERKQLHGVDSHSAFFTSHKSPIEVGFADSPNVKPRPIRRRTSSGGGGAGAFGMFLLIWTVIALGCGYLYFESVRIPGLRDEIRKREFDAATTVWVDKMTTAQTNMQSLKRENAQFKKENLETDSEKTKELKDSVDQLENQLKTERVSHTQSLKAELEKNAVSQVVSVLDMQKGIQEISKRALVEK
jgi:uncharacterized protein HemX